MNRYEISLRNQICGGWFQPHRIQKPNAVGSQRKCRILKLQTRGTYIQIDPDEDRPTAEDALAGKNSLYDEVKKLIAVRKEHQALQNTAPMEFVYVKESAYPLVYKRTGKDETIYIVLNHPDRMWNVMHRFRSMRSQSIPIMEKQLMQMVNGKYRQHPLHF